MRATRSNPSRSRIGKRHPARRGGARPVASLAELRTAREVQHAAFSTRARSTRSSCASVTDGKGSTARRSSRSSTASSSRPAYAAHTPHGSILFGGATLPAARGRGAYRALVAARAAEAAARDARPLSSPTRAGCASDPRAARVRARRAHRPAPGRPLSRGRP